MIMLFIQKALIKHIHIYEYDKFSCSQNIIMYFILKEPYRLRKKGISFSNIQTDDLLHVVNS